MIASGNQAVLSSADYLQTLARQDDLGAVALYLEDDGGAGLSTASRPARMRTCPSSC